MKSAVDLSFLTDLASVFFYLDVLPRHGTYCLTHMSEHVQEHVITTNGGRKRRKIYAPSKLLSWVQNRIRHNLLFQIPVSDCVHGFVRGRGTVSNAMVHANRRQAWVMNIDLKDFFPSISRVRVIGLYRSLFAFPNKVAASLARITTHDDHLAQGFCTSPDLANFAAWRLDRRLMALAAKLDIHYTRYADDLTFSSPTNDIKADYVLDKVSHIVEDEGFRVNRRKIAVMRSGRRQKVTGLVVSEHGVNVPRRARRILRSAVHHWREQTPERRVAIRGWISYLHAVDPAAADRLFRAIDAAEADVGRTWVKSVGSGPFSSDISSSS